MTAKAGKKENSAQSESGSYVELIKIPLDASSGATTIAVDWKKEAVYIESLSSVLMTADTLALAAVSGDSLLGSAKIALLSVDLNKKIVNEGSVEVPLPNARLGQPIVVLDGKSSVSVYVHRARGDDEDIVHWKGLTTEQESIPVPAHTRLDGVWPGKTPQIFIRSGTKMDSHFEVCS